MLQLFETMLQQCCNNVATLLRIVPCNITFRILGLLNDPRDLSAQDDAQFLKLTYYWRQNYFLSASETIQSDLPFSGAKTCLNLTVAVV